MGDPFIDPTFGEVVPRHENTDESSSIARALFARFVTLINKFPVSHQLIFQCESSIGVEVSVLNLESLYQ